MKSVLISIQPKWCRLIANGKKTIEVRKSRPKLETPFKCYIYCTKHKERLLEVVHKGDDMGYCVYDEDTPMFIKTFADTALLGTNLVSKVIGEFVCDRITDISVVVRNCNEDYNHVYHNDECKGSCLTWKELQEYGNSKPLYGWHISNLKIYDKPKELSEFKHFQGKDLCCLGCNHTETCQVEEVECCMYAYKPLTRPPQSWCYVEPFGE